MGISTKEYDAAKGERDGVEIGTGACEWGCYVAVDGVRVYEDGGEVEDLTVTRDLWPLVMALRALAAERTALRERLARCERESALEQSRLDL